MLAPTSEDLGVSQEDFDIAFTHARAYMGQMAMNCNNFAPDIVGAGVAQFRAKLEELANARKTRDPLFTLFENEMAAIREEARARWESYRAS